MLEKKFKKIIISLLLSLLVILPVNNAILQNIEAKCSPFLNSNIANENIHGFSLKKTLYFKGHPIFQYQHEKSGAWVIVEKNNNIDKKFEISVRTPPENNKGINHIIEHCVLNGSLEYPCKNIIWELQKSANATFINAMTTPTYTTFPVSSIDEDELESLAKVYTSGVLHPLFLNDEKIFKKEGVRYELNRKGKLQPNGTVFNEMQQDTAVIQGFVKRVFPDTQGKNISGGLPEDIMDLSYKELCDTYKKYYHPSNMLINLTGDINHEKFFKWLDKDYLSTYENQKTSPVHYLHQNNENLKKYEISHYYKKNTDKNIIDIAIGYIIKPELYKESSDKLNIISSVINNPSSPRTKFLKEKGYLDINMRVANTFYDPLVTIDLFTDKINLTSQDCVEKTLDELFEKYPVTQAEIDQVINEDNFNDKFDQNTQLYENHISSNSFILSFVRFGDPCSLNYFHMDQDGNTVSEFDSDISEKNIHNTINEFLSKNKQLITIFLPTDDLKLNTANKIEEKLKSMESHKEILTKNYQEQKKWAESANSPENTNLIKSIFKKLCDINTPDFKCPIDKNIINGKEYYQSVQEIGDFISCKFIFKINHLSDDDKKYWEILLNCFILNDTKNYSREELEKQKSGKFNINLSYDIHEETNGEKNAFLTVNIISQKDDIQETFELLKEQVNNIDFKDKRTLQEFLKIKNSFYESTPKTFLKFRDLVSTQNSYEKIYLNGNQTEEDKNKFFKELLSSIDSKEFLNFFSQKAENIRSKTFNQKSLEGIGICASEKNQDLAKSIAQDFVQSLSNEKIADDAKLYFPPPQNKNIAFIEPSQSNNEIICVIDSKELSNDINFNLTCELLNNVFLMPLIREKNGAYGASIFSDPDNDKIIIRSTKDPNISSTVNVFKSIPQFIKAHEFTTEEIENVSKNFLGSLFVKNKLDLSDNQIEKAVCQKTDHCDVLNKNIKKIKTMSQEEIKRHGKILENLISNMRIYAISGNLQESDRKLFDMVIE